MNFSLSFQNDAAQAQISDLLQSLLYKCRLYGKFFEKRREQQFQRIVQSEHRKRKRLERLQNRKTVLTEVIMAFWYALLLKCCIIYSQP